MKTSQRKTKRPDMTNEMKKQFKKELLEVFRKFGYLSEDKDHEVTIRTTSGNIAWININSMETIK
jgi:hypothetical protein